MPVKRRSLHDRFWPKVESGRTRCRECARACDAEAKRAWRARNPEKVAAYGKAWRDRNPNYDRARYLALKERSHA